MSPRSSSTKNPAEQVTKDIRSATRRSFLAEDKIRIVLDGLRGEESIAASLEVEQTEANFPV
jgi:transposase